MAGIKEAMQRVIDKENVGTVLAKGYLKECDCCNEEVGSGCNCNDKTFMVLSINNKIELHIDYNGDVRFDNDIELRDIVTLNISDNYTAKWQNNN